MIERRGTRGRRYYFYNMKEHSVMHKQNIFQHFPNSNPRERRAAATTHPRNCCSDVPSPIRSLHFQHTPIIENHTPAQHNYTAAVKGTTGDGSTWVTYRFKHTIRFSFLTHFTISTYHEYLSCPFAKPCTSPPKGKPQRATHTYLPCPLTPHSTPECSYRPSQGLRLRPTIGQDRT